MDWEVDRIAIDGDSAGGLTEGVEAARYTSIRVKALNVDDI